MNTATRYGFLKNGRHATNLHQVLRIRAQFSLVMQYICV